MHVLQIAPRCNGPFHPKARVRSGRAVDRHCALSVRICAAYAITERRRDRERRKGDTRARGEGRTGVPRPPKVKSRDGEGPSGDRALRETLSQKGK